MSLYKEYDFTLKSPEVHKEILMALLAAAGFEGFVETDKGFKVYTDLDLNPEEIVNDYKNKFSYTSREVPEENWNKSWEAQIKPLVIDDRVYIKTSFHPEKNYPLVITIDPKMSFGTGHHETTYLMIRQLLELDLKGKKLLDMGAGTGVLSILAQKLGARDVYAVDNDKWAYENMLENFEKNQTPDIKTYLGDAQTIADFPVFDIVLANINRNILLNDMHQYVQKLEKGGLLILSGFYREDIPLLKNEAQKYGMIFESEKEKNKWISLRFKKM